MLFRSEKCRLGINVGLHSLSFVELDYSASGWTISKCGEIPFEKDNAVANADAKELQEIFERFFKENQLDAELLHLTLHSAYCVTRVTIGEPSHVDRKLDSFRQNSQHYLQMGLGEKVAGEAIDELDPQNRFGYMSIVKSGLIENIEQALAPLEIEMDAIDCGLISVCRLIGRAKLDSDAPLLVIWSGAKASQIGVSFQGRLQLSYQATEARTPAKTAEIVGKHLMRLKRFCNRYRDGGESEPLTNVLLLSESGETDELKGLINELGFAKVFSIEDLIKPIHFHCDSKEIPKSIGFASALGGMLATAEEGHVAPTDLFSNYLRTKQTNVAQLVFRDFWLSWAAAIVFVAIMGGKWWVSSQLESVDDEIVQLEFQHDEERMQIAELTRASNLHEQYALLESHTEHAQLPTVVLEIAHSLPTEARLESLTLDSNSEIQMKGQSLGGDRSYEIISKLRKLPMMSDVSLVAVDHPSDPRDSSTYFQIKCILNPSVSHPSPQKFVAKVDGDK